MTFQLAFPSEKHTGIVRLLILKPKLGGGENR